MGEKKDRVTDALNATKAAVEEGIVPGGGTALLYASTGLDGVKDSLAVFDQQVGVQIVQRALKVPLVTIANNAGADGSVIAGKLLEKAPADRLGGALGYNAATGVFEDLVKAGVIDPLKVVRTALLDASSVASLMTTTEAIVVDAPEPKAAAGGGAPGAGGMGGYGDMY